MNITNTLAGIMTQDITTASTWYENLFNRPADTMPMEGLAEWRFQESGVCFNWYKTRSGLALLASRSP